MEEAQQQSEYIWYILPPGSKDTEGPFSTREIDVKFRTKELTSMFHVWKEGMAEWKKVFEIDELKQLLMEITQEIGEQKGDVQQKKNNLAKEEVKEVDKKEEREDEEFIDSDVCYYSKPEKLYKLFDPVSKSWTAQPEKPSDEMLLELKTLLEASLPIKPPSDDIAQLAAEEALKKISDQNEANEEQNDQVDDQGKPLTAEEIQIREQKRLKKKRYQENKKRKWFQTKVNHYIYVQGLPDDVTEIELKDYFVRCGVIRLDPANGKEQIKIYKNEEGIPKGDARIGYAMLESVDMAIEMLNESEFRPGHKITVQLAEFQQKGGDYVPKKKQKVDKLEQIRIKAEQDRQFAWEDDLETLHEQGLRIIVIEGFYTEEEVEQQEKNSNLNFFFEELELELRGEIESSIGPIERVQFFPENPAQGIVKIKFTSALHAQQCIDLMNGRFFDGRALASFFWDGKTDYRIVRETKEEIEQRLDDFGKWLEGEGQEEIQD